MQQQTELLHTQTPTQMLTSLIMLLHIYIYIYYL